MPTDPHIPRPRQSAPSIDWIVKEARRTYPVNAPYQIADTQWGKLVNVWPVSGQECDVHLCLGAIPTGWRVECIDINPDRAKVTFLHRDGLRVEANLYFVSGAPSEPGFWAKLTAKDEL